MLLAFWYLGFGYFDIIQDLVGQWLILSIDFDIYSSVLHLWYVLWTWYCEWNDPAHGDATKWHDRIRLRYDDYDDLWFNVICK